MTGTQSHISGQRTHGFLPPWDGAAYAANTAHHRRYDDDYLATLPLRPTDRVLDLGCGSGDLTATIAGLVPDGEVVGLDAQPSMIEEARARAGGNQSFVVAPVQELDAVLQPGDTFDVVCSRAALHWVPAAGHPAVLAACRARLHEGGVLRIECGGGDNVREAVPFLDDIAAGFGRPPGCPWTLFGCGTYLDLLLDAGFSVDGGFVRTNAQRRAFNRESLLSLMHSQFLQAHEATIDPANHTAFRSAVDERVDELQRPDGSYDLTFVRLDVLAFAA